MKTPEIGSLVTGILAIVGLALALGQYGRLETWARNQAIEAMRLGHRAGRHSGSDRDTNQ